MTPGSAQRSTAIRLVSSPVRRRASHSARIPRISSPALLIAGVSVAAPPQLACSTQARTARQRHACRGDWRISREALAIAFPLLRPIAANTRAAQRFAGAIASFVFLLGELAMLESRVYRGPAPIHVSDE